MPAAAVAQQVVRERPVTLQLDIDAQGKVTAVKAMDPVPMMNPTGSGHLIAETTPYGPLPAVFAHAATQMALNWRFRPLKVAGKPTSGRTWARTTLQVVKRKDGNFAVDLRYERNGPFVSYRVMPRYPEQMIRGHITGALAVEYVIEPNGSIDGIRILGAFGDIAHHEDPFEQAVRKSLEESRGLPLLVDGKPLATRMRMPFYFTVGDTSKAEMDRQIKEVDGVIRSGLVRDINYDPSASGEAVAADSPFVMQPSG